MDFHSGKFFAQDLGLLVKCFYQNQINPVCNFYNLYVFVVTRDKTCYLLFREHILWNVGKTMFCFHHSVNRLFFHNATKQFEIFLNKDGCFETNRGDFDGKCEKADPNWREYNDTKVNVSKNIVMVFEKNVHSFHTFKTALINADCHSIVEKLNHLLILEISDSQRYSIFDFETCQIYPLDFDLDQNVPKKCLNFVHLPNTKMIALIIYNKCTIFKLLENKWVVYRKILHKLHANYYAFCEDEQRMIKFF